MEARALLDVETAEKEKRKTSVIIHGIKESDSEDSKKREEDDLGVVASMLHELKCENAAVQKVVRLGKRLDSVEDNVPTKPRPMKMVVETEEQRNLIIRSAKKLKTSPGRRLENGLYTPGPHAKGKGTEGTTGVRAKGQEAEKKSGSYSGGEQDSKTETILDLNSFEDPSFTAKDTCSGLKSVFQLASFCYPLASWNTDFNAAHPTVGLLSNCWMNCIAVSLIAFFPFWRVGPGQVSK